MPGLEQPVQGDLVRGGNLADELRGGVDDQFLMPDLTAVVPSRLQETAEPLDLGGADAGADAGLRSKLGQAGRADEAPTGDHDDVVGDLLDLSQRVTGYDH